MHFPLPLQIAVSFFTIAVTTRAAGNWTESSRRTDTAMKVSHHSCDQRVYYHVTIMWPESILSCEYHVTREYTIMWLSCDQRVYYHVTIMWPERVYYRVTVTWPVQIAASTRSVAVMRSCRLHVIFVESNSPIQSSQSEFENYSIAFSHVHWILCSVLLLHLHMKSKVWRKRAHLRL